MEYEAQYHGEQCMVKTENPRNEISKVLLKREWEFLAALEHPCILQLLKIPDNPESPILLTESVWTSLAEFLADKQSHCNKISILHDIACGLHYIHGKDIIHCDLTAYNIFLTENITAKLANFGRATINQHKIQYPSKSLDHIPPEIFEHFLNYIVGCSTKVDIFSFGCTIIHTLTQELPIPDFGKYVETSEIGKYKKYSEIDRRSTCLKKIKNDIKLYDVVLRCLQDDPNCRPTAAVLLAQLEDELKVAKKLNVSFKFGMCYLF